MQQRVFFMPEDFQRWTDACRREFGPLTFIDDWSRCHLFEAGMAAWPVGFYENPAAVRCFAGLGVFADADWRPEYGPGSHGYPRQRVINRSRVCISTTTVADVYPDDLDVVPPPVEYIPEISIVVQCDWKNKEDSRIGRRIMRLLGVGASRTCLAFRLTDREPPRVIDRWMLMGASATAWLKERPERLCVAPGLAASRLRPIDDIGIFGPDTRPLHVEPPPAPPAKPVHISARDQVRAEVAEQERHDADPSIWENEKRYRIEVRRHRIATPWPRPDKDIHYAMRSTYQPRLMPVSPIREWPPWPKWWDLWFGR